MKRNTTTTVKYEHRLINEHKFNFYNEVVFEKGSIMAVTKSPRKLEEYYIVLAHGNSELVLPNQVEIFEITRKTTIEVIEKKLN